MQDICMDYMTALQLGQVLLPDALGRIWNKQEVCMYRLQHGRHAQFLLSGSKPLRQMGHSSASQKLSLGDAIIFREISFNNSALLGNSSPDSLMNLCCSIKLRSSTVLVSCKRGLYMYIHIYTSYDISHLLNFAI
jgi:hypothetical protein